MRRIPSLVFALLLFAGATQSLYAQNEESRNKIQMTAIFGGKTFLTELYSISPSISRYHEYPGENSRDSLAKVGAGTRDKRGSVYLTINVKKVDTKLLQLFSKRDSTFDGTITITDTYGKNPTRTFKFSKASIESYSDQFSTTSYNDGYSAASLVITCTELSIDGVEIEL